MAETMKPARKTRASKAASKAEPAKTVPELHRVVPLSQDPHSVRDTRENVLEVAIGHEVRTFRKQLGITVADLAAATNISLGMLSKIENGITSPSLTTLQALSRALGVPLTALFRRFEEERSAVFIKAGEGVDVERRGTRRPPVHAARPYRRKYERRCRRALSHHACGRFRRVPDLPA